MTFAEAHNYMDLLLDKADQPFFTTEEKDKFLTLAINEWYEEALDKWDVDNKTQEAIRHMLIIETEYFHHYGNILATNRTDGKHITTYHSPHIVSGVAKGAQRGLTYPLKRIKKLAIQYWDQYSLQRRNWKDVRKNLWENGPGHGIESDMNGREDPFNASSPDYPTYQLSSDYIRVMPQSSKDTFNKRLGSTRYRLMGSSHSWWNGTYNFSSLSNGRPTDNDTFTSSNAARYRITYFTYPLASNVAGGNHDWTWGNQVNNMGTADCVVGAILAKRDFFFDLTQASANNQAIAASSGEHYNDGYSKVKYKGFPEWACLEICKRATRMMTGTVESPNYPVIAAEAEN